MRDISAGNIGVIGLGLMGGHMARNLLTAGAKLTVHNRSPEKMTPFVADGAERAVDPAGVADAVGAGIIIICVNDTDSLQVVFEGADDGRGLRAALKPGTLVIDMGTSKVKVTRVLAGLVKQQDCHLVDAPVSGGEIGAKAGTLSIMAGGSDEAIARAAPVFDVLGGSWTHIGPVGAGQVAKAANQLIVGQTLVAVAEALALVDAAGASRDKVREALLGGFASSRILEVHGQRMIDGQFDPGGRAETQLKDLVQTIELAEQAHVILPGLERTTELWQQMVDKGWAGLDQAGIYKLITSLT
jgi:3-hydroxyisobutyrate dehydrogenase-like beta-hydroxyacid dehydrogenase